MIMKTNDKKKKLSWKESGELFTSLSCCNQCPYRGNEPCKTCPHFETLSKAFENGSLPEKKLPVGMKRLIKGTKIITNKEGKQKIVKEVLQTVYNESEHNAWDIDRSELKQLLLYVGMKNYEVKFNEVKDE